MDKAIKNYQKVIKMKEFREKHYSNYGPFGEERHEKHMDIRSLKPDNDFGDIS